MAEVEVSPVDATMNNNGAWHAVLVVEGVRTSDGREFTPNSLRWRTLPIPLMWQQQTSEQHKGAVVVGKISRIERQENGEVHGWGTFDLGSAHGKEAHRLVSEQIMRGISIDAELLEINRERMLAAEENDGKMVLIVEEARIGAATIVAFPAFPQAVIALDGAEIPDSTEDGRAEALVAAVITDRPWNPDTTRFSFSELMEAAAATHDDDISPQTLRSAYFLPHHEPDGTLSRRGLHAAASSFNLIEAPAQIKARARAHLADHFRFDLNESPPKLLMQQALLAHADQPGPPAEWFDNPELKGPQPLTVARNGRIYGHAALWDACHVGYKNTCMMAPRSRTSYAYFLTGVVYAAGCDCDNGIPTGPLVLNTSHADPYVSAEAARRHYDHTGQAVADVAVGEDAFGIWVAGALRPGVSETQIRALRGSALSGDWRHIAGNMELVSLLAVNTPGFPVPRTAAALDHGVQVSLTAAGISEDTPPEDDTPSTGTDPSSIIEELKRELGKKAEEEEEPESTPQPEHEQEQESESPQPEPDAEIEPEPDAEAADSTPAVPVSDILASMRSPS